MELDTFEIELDGATLTGVELGEGVPVVFLHAGVCDHRMWHKQMELVADAGCHAIAYDRRGFGDTVAEDVPFSHLEDLEEILDAMDVYAAVFVGASMGGGLAIDFALAHPGRVLGLVLAGTSVTGAPYEILESEMPLIMAEEDADERGDLDMLNKVHAHAWLDGPESVSGRVGGDARQLFLAMNAAALAKPALTQEEARPAAYERVKAVTAPGLLVVGDLDFGYIQARHEYLSEEMPNVFAAALEGVAHLPNLERPDLFDPLLMEFLDALFGGDADEAEDD